MDSWETRYMHEGKEYVRDDYSGTSIPLSIWQKMRTAYTTCYCYSSDHKTRLGP
jgi:hypothetical protein